MTSSYPAHEEDGRATDKVCEHDRENRKINLSPFSLSLERVQRNAVERGETAGYVVFFLLLSLTRYEFPGPRFSSNKSIALMRLLKFLNP